MIVESLTLLLHYEISFLVVSSSMIATTTDGHRYIVQTRRYMELARSLSFSRNT